MIRRVWSKLVLAAKPNLSAFQLKDVIGCSATPTSLISFRLPATPSRAPSDALLLLFDGYSLNKEEIIHKTLSKLHNLYKHYYCHKQSDPFPPEVIKTSRF